MSNEEMTPAEKYKASMKRHKKVLEEITNCKCETV